MSTYLHVFPTNNEKMRESFAKTNGLVFNDNSEGRSPTQQEFDDITSKVAPYEYELREDGSISLRRGPVEDLFKILQGVAQLCGSQVVFNDNMEAIIFDGATASDDFENSILFE